MNQLNELKICCQCKIPQELGEYNKNSRAADKLCYHCKSCSKKYRNYKRSSELAKENSERYKKYKSEQRKTDKGLLTVLFNRIQRRTREVYGGIAIDKETLGIILENSKIKFGKLLSNEPHSPRIASVDRFDNSKGYTEDNIQIIPAWLNYAYNDYDKTEVNNEIIAYAEYLKSINKTLTIKEIE